MTKSKKKLDLNLFESVIAYHALFNPEYLSGIIDHLKPELFQRAETKAAIFPIVDFFNEHNTVPSITEIKIRLKENTERELFAKLLKEFTTLDKSFNLKELLTNTEQFFKERSLVYFLNKTATQLAKEGTVNYDDAYAELESAIGLSLIDDIGLEYFKDFEKHLEYLDKKESRLSTGWNWLDEKLGGGLLEEGRSLYIFCGTTNVGKSIFLGNVANNIVKQGKCAVIITLEMPEQIYAKRISSQLSRIPINTLAEKKEHLRSWMNQYSSDHLDSKLFIKEFPPSSVSANHIRAYLTKLVRKGIKIDAIIIDYLNLMVPCRGSGDGNSYEKIKKIAEECRALSYVFNAPVISATQLNRCISTSSVIIRADGTADKIINLKKDDIIKGYDKNVTVRHIYPIEKQKCFKIKTKSGKEIICSKRHLFPINKINKFKSIEMGLKVGDKLFTATQ